MTVRRQKRMPAHVSLILGREVHLEALEDAELAALGERGLTPVRALLGPWTLQAPAVPGPLHEHPDGMAFLSALAEAGVAFLRDPRQGWSPADVIEGAIERGAHPGRVSICAFNGFHWTLSDVGAS